MPVLDTPPNSEILASTGIPCHSIRSLGNSTPDTLLCAEWPRGIPWPPAVPLEQEPTSVSPHVPERIDSCGSVYLSSPATMSGDQPLVPYQQPPAPRPHLPPGPGPGPQSDMLGLGIVVKAPVGHQTQPDLSFRQEWSRIKRLRVEIWSIRSKIREKREILREKQHSKARADDNYLQFVRLCGHGIQLGSHDASDERKTMEGLFQACELARNDYGPFEDDLSLLEDRLSVLEFELDKLERRFYDRSPEIQAPLLHEHDVAPDSTSSSISSGSEMGKQVHPDVVVYQSKVGDVEILRERLDDLLEERYALEDEREKRHRVNLELADNDLLWLEEFSAIESNLIEQFERAEKEAEDLKQMCLSRGLVDDAGNPTSFEYREHNAFSDDSDLVAGSETSEFVKFPILIQDPSISQAQVKLAAVDEEVMSQKSSAVVNWWLLDQLRMSPMNVNLLARIYVSQFGPIDKREKWQVDVLDYWYVDGARNSRSGPQTSTGVSLLTQALLQPSNNIRASSDEPEIRLTTEDMQRLRNFEIGPVQSSEDKSLPGCTRLNPLGDV